MAWSSSGRAARSQKVAFIAGHVLKLLQIVIIYRGPLKSTVAKSQSSSEAASGLIIRPHGPACHEETTLPPREVSTWESGDMYLLGVIYNL